MSEGNRRDVRLCGTGRSRHKPGRPDPTRPIDTGILPDLKSIHMRRRRLGLVIAILAIAVAVDLRAAGFTGAPACPSNGTLATLISFNSNLIPGCTIHGLTYSGFSWTQTGTNALTPNSVNYSMNDSLGILDFTSSLFTVTGSDTLIYTLEYVVDPPPIIIRAFDEDLFTETPIAPGFARIPTTICLGAAFVGSTCSTTTTSVLTFHNGLPNGTTRLHDSTTFVPQSEIGVMTIVDLEANGASSSISGFSNTIELTPEPASYLLVILGLAAIVVLARKRARLLCISPRKSD